MLIVEADLTPHHPLAPQGSADKARSDRVRGWSVCGIVPEGKFSVKERNETQIADLGGYLPSTRYSDRTRGTVRGSRRLQYDVGNEHPIRPSEWHSKVTCMKICMV